MSSSPARIACWTALWKSASAASTSRRISSAMIDVVRRGAGRRRGRQTSGHRLGHAEPLFGRLPLDAPPGLLMVRASFGEVDVVALDALPVHRGAVAGQAVAAFAAAIRDHHGAVVLAARPTAAGGRGLDALAVGERYAGLSRPAGDGARIHLAFLARRPSGAWTPIQISAIGGRLVS